MFYAEGKCCESVQVGSGRFLPYGKQMVFAMHRRYRFMELEFSCMLSTDADRSYQIHLS